MKKVQTALISVYNKSNLDPVLKALAKHDVDIISTGGTYDYIKTSGYKKVHSVESITDFPSILGGRVKTLHPKIFGAVLARSEPQDVKELDTYGINPIDLVIVDLYPFMEAVNRGASEQAIIEKIDIGGVSLLRAAAKNYKEVWTIPSRMSYQEFIRIYELNKGSSSEDNRKDFAARTFDVTTNYDWFISDWFMGAR